MVCGEDNFVESIPSFYLYMGSKDQMWVPRLAIVTIFTSWAISPASLYLYFFETGCLSVAQAASKSPSSCFKISSVGIIDITILSYHILTWYLSDHLILQGSRWDYYFNQISWFGLDPPEYLAPLPNVNSHIGAVCSTSL